MFEYTNKERMEIISGADQMAAELREKFQSGHNDLSEQSIMEHNAHYIGILAEHGINPFTGTPTEKCFLRMVGELATIGMAHLIEQDTVV